MKIGLKGGRPASQTDIAALEQKLGAPLPAELLVFVSQDDGAVPDANVFTIGSANSAGVNGFIPIKEIVGELARIEGFPARSIPVAWAEGGNYVFISQAEGGAVFFWDHEQPTRGVKLAPSFRAFLELLEPFDVSSISLKPGQVISTWVDPNFLKELNG